MSIAQLVPLLKIIGVFVVMLALIRVRVSLFLSILAGAAAMGIFFAMSPATWFGAALSGLTQGKTLFLAAIVGLILLLSELMEETGQAERLLTAASGLIRSRRLRLIFFPALIGLLPMPGGAVFSAPMVKSVGEKLGAGDEDMSLVNYWFRHLWEPFWPLYPGIILASSLAGVPLPKLSLYLAPTTVVYGLLGWIFYLRPGRLKLNHDQGRAVQPGQWRVALREGVPLLLAIFGSLFLGGIIMLAAPGMAFEWGVIAGLVLAILAALRSSPGSSKSVIRILSTKHLYMMLLVVGAIFVFKEVLADSGAIQELAALAGGGVALMAAAVLLPFLVGLVAGINLAFVGATFPLLLGLVSQLGLSDQKMAYLVLASISGYTGVMTSPIHLCFVLSCQYFRVDLTRTWRRLLTPGLLLAAFAVAYFLLLSA